MKLNPNLFHKLDHLEPFRTETTSNGTVLEFYYLNDCDQETYDNCIARKQLEFNSCLNSKLIRIAVEKGAYEIKKDIFTPECNNLFTELLVKLEKPQKLSRYALIPAALVVLGLILFNAFSQVKISTWILFGCVALVLIYMILTNVFLKKSIDKTNAYYNQKFVDLVGQARFQEISEALDVHAQQLILEREQQTQAAEASAENSEIIASEENVEKDADTGAEELTDLNYVTPDPVTEFLDDVAILDATISEEKDGADLASEGEPETEEANEEEVLVSDNDELNII